MKLYFIKILNNICEEEHYVLARSEEEARELIIKMFNNCKILKMKLICDEVII